MLDVDALEPRQVEALIDHLSLRFGSDRRDAEHDVWTRGVPIRLGPDTRIDVPAGYRAPRWLLENGPHSYSLRLLL